MEERFPIDRLSEVIADLQADTELDSLSEVDISQSVRTVFRALGWDTDNRREVKQEYAVGNDRVDYALFIGGAEQVFVEVKKGGESLEHHQAQLLRYAFQEDIQLALLTNGTVWWFYLPRQSGNWEQRRFATISLDEWERAEVVRVLADVLSKENVENGSALQNADRLYKQMQRQNEVSKRLPEAWNQLIDGFDELIVARLQKKVGELCKHEPDENEVKAFLSTHREGIRIPPTPEPRTRDLAPDNPARRSSRSSQTRLAVTLNGTTIDDKVAASAFVEVIDRIGIQRVKDLNLTVNGTDLISASEDTQQRRELDGYWINVNTSTQVKKRLLEDIASGLDDVRLTVEIIPK